MKTKSALPYFGSDSEIAAQLGSLMDNCRHVTIPFVGGASIIPYLTAKAIVANDKNSLAINFYKVVSGWMGTNAEIELRNMCDRTLSHPHELECASHIVSGYLENKDTEPVKLAWAYWTTCWVGRKGLGGTQKIGGKPSVRRKANGGNNATRIRAAADDLEAWANQFERCEWDAGCFRDLLPKVADDPTCGIYCDPPWFKSGDSYLHSFTEDDHVSLASLLAVYSETRVVVRYGDCDRVRELYEEWFFHVVESRTQSNSKIKEVWITNFEWEQGDGR